MPSSAGGGDAELGVGGSVADAVTNKSIDGIAVSGGGGGGSDRGKGVDGGRVWEWLYEGGKIVIDDWKKRPWWEGLPKKDNSPDDVHCVRVAANLVDGKFGWWPNDCKKPQPYLCVKVV